MILYRSVGSGPYKYIERGGFKPWVPLSEKQARDWLLYLYGARDKPGTFPPRSGLVSWMGQYKTVRPKPYDFMRYMIAQKSRDTPHISTSDHPECGGYSEGYDYQVRVRNVRIAKATRGNLGGEPKTLQGKCPDLVLETGKSVLNSSVLGMAEPVTGGYDLYILRPIQIKIFDFLKYRKSGAGKWEDFPKGRHLKPKPPSRFGRLAKSRITGSKGGK